MAMTLRLTEQEQHDLRICAAQLGVSMQDAARQAIREYIIRSDHRSRVAESTGRIMAIHADALERLGQ